MLGLVDNSGGERTASGARSLDEGSLEAVVDEEEFARLVQGPAEEFFARRKELSRAGIDVFAFNNVGNSFKESPIPYNTHDYERETMREFGKLLPVVARLRDSRVVAGHFRAGVCESWERRDRWLELGDSQTVG